MIKVYMVCDYTDDKASSISTPLNIGVEHMGTCGGRILHEDGTLIGSHSSSSFGWLRCDLKSYLDDLEEYEIIDLIGQEVPERFRLPSAEEMPNPSRIEVNRQRLIEVIGSPEDCPLEHNCPLSIDSCGSADYRTECVPVIIAYLQRSE